MSSLRRHFKKNWARENWREYKTALGVEAWEGSGGELYIYSLSINPSILAFPKQFEMTFLPYKITIPVANLVQYVPHYLCKFQGCQIVAKI